MALTFQQYRFLFWVMLLHTVCAAWVMGENIPAYYLFGPALVFYFGFFRVRALQGQLASYPLALRLFTYAVLAAGWFLLAVEIPYGKEISAAQWLAGVLAVSYCLSRSITPQQVAPVGLPNGGTMASIEQQFNVTAGVLGLYAACFFSVTFWNTPEVLPFGVATLFCALFFRARAKKAPPTVYPLALRLYTYAILAAGAIGSSYKTSFGNPLLLTLSVLGIGVMLYFLTLHSAQERFARLGISLADTPKEVTTPAEQPAAPDAGPALTLDAPLSKQLIAWTGQYFPTPLSRRYAAIAAALRVLEQGHDAALAQRAAEQAALAWAPPPGVTLRLIDFAQLKTQDPWNRLLFKVDSLSQQVAISAALLRALELGQDEATAMAAGEKMRKAWALPAGQKATTNN
jgi:hypothetical protein